MFPTAGAVSRVTSDRVATRPTPGFCRRPTIVSPCLFAVLVDEKKPGLDKGLEGQSRFYMSALI
jgi:hypothetical protein